MNEECNYINIADRMNVCSVLGPGKRYVIWVQGCIFNCKGCINKELQGFEYNCVINVQTIIDEIKRYQDKIEGITLTGGEPFLQPISLAKIAKKAREIGLNVICYTGFQLEQLVASQNRHVYALLDELDVLIDGCYDENKKSDSQYKGSDNQNIYFFTDSYDASDFNVKNNFQIVNNNNDIKIVGFFDERARYNTK